MNTRTITRLGSFAGVAALALTTLVVSSAPATAQTAGDRAVDAGAKWLEGQLTSGLIHNNVYDFDDLGLSADVAFALDAVGGHDATVTDIAEAISPIVSSWYDSWGTVYTGSAAKAAALAQVSGQDATNFGGHDLIDVVEDNVATTAPISGRVQNVGETDWQPPFSPMDSLNVISQSWAARALHEQSSPLADEVETFLLDQQCAAGFFRATLTVDKAATEQGCDAAGGVASLDTTAITLLNLLAEQNPTAEVSTAIDEGAAWLLSQQAADGSFSAGGAEGFNANTTGLAGWVLGEVGESAAATKAASWLRGLQIADIAPCATTLTAHNGAIAYQAPDLAQSRDDGDIAVAD